MPATRTRIVQAPAEKIRRLRELREREREHDEQALAGVDAFAVLGYMAELGSSSASSHVEAGAYAAAKGVAGLIAVGDEAAPVLDGARSVPSWHGEAVAVPDGSAAVQFLRDQLKPGDVVLVKASRAASMESAAAELLAEAAQ